MTVGIPGVGFGGLFYLVSALCMPFRELARSIRGETGGSRWALVGAQWTMAVVILAALWATGWVLGHALAPAGPLRVASGAAGLVAPHNVLKVSALVLTLGLLSILALGVRIAHVVLHSRGGIPPQLLVPMKAAAGARPAAFSDQDEYRRTGTDGWRRVDSGQIPPQR